ncbi:MAG: hypothetical protein ACYSSN_07530 [Planctomycetota bacterium]
MKRLCSSRLTNPANPTDRKLFDKGDGRTYTITITATDVNGSESVSVIEILAPHDRRKKTNL